MLLLFTILLQIRSLFLYFKESGYANLSLDAFPASFSPDAAQGLWEFRTILQILNQNAFQTMSPKRQDAIWAPRIAPADGNGGWASEHRHRSSLFRAASVARWGRQEERDQRLRLNKFPMILCSSGLNFHQSRGKITYLITEHAHTHTHTHAERYVEVWMCVLSGMMYY